MYETLKTLDFSDNVLNYGELLKKILQFNKIFEAIEKAEAPKLVTEISILTTRGLLII